MFFIPSSLSDLNSVSVCKGQAYFHPLLVSVTAGFVSVCVNKAVWSPAPVCLCWCHLTALLHSRGDPFTTTLTRITDNTTPGVRRERQIYWLFVTQAHNSYFNCSMQKKKKNVNGEEEDHNIQ